MSRHIELIAAALAAIAVIGAIVGLSLISWSESVSCTAFADPEAGATQICIDDTDYVWDQQPLALIAGAVLLLAFTASVTGGAWWHVRQNSAAGRNLLWAATALAVGLTFLAIASIGLLFAPAAIFAIVASAAAAARRTPVEPATQAAGR